MLERKTIETIGIFIVAFIVMYAVYYFMGSSYFTQIQERDDPQVVSKMETLYQLQSENLSAMGKAALIPQ